jgi:hypothetical protein
MSTDFILNPALPRAVVLGLFGGIGLALTSIYSRRGPLIYPVYAAVLASLTLLLSRYAALSFSVRLVAALAGFCAASLVSYIAVGILAQRDRELLVASGQLRENARNYKTSVLGHAWRWGFLLAVGTIASAGVAFISG